MNAALNAGWPEFQFYSLPAAVEASLQQFIVFLRVVQVSCVWLQRVLGVKFSAVIQKR